MILLVGIGSGVVLFGSVFLALQLISGTPLNRAYAHAAALITGGLVVMQAAWLMSGDVVYFVGGVCGIPLCLLITFVAYTQDRGYLRRKRARRGRRLANAHLKEMQAS